MRVDVPLGGRYRGGVHQGALQARDQERVVAGEPVTSVQAPGLTRVDLVGPMLVVGELVRREAP